MLGRLQPPAAMRSIGVSSGPLSLAAGFGRGFLLQPVRAASTGKRVVTTVVHPPGTPDDHSLSSLTSSPNRGVWSSVHVGIGSNLGDRTTHMHEAIARIRQVPQTKLERTSFLYETESFYDTDQPKFLNGVLKLRTRLPPREVLQHLQRIEQELGRCKTAEAEYRYPARQIDLDILLFNSMELQSPDLTIPHPQLAERSFVLRPLNDVDPEAHHPVLGKTARELLNELLYPKPAVLATRSGGPVLGRDQTPIDVQQKAGQDRLCMSLDPAGQNLLYWGSRTYVMGVLNVTPDSFSDGGQFQEAEAAVRRAIEMLAAGADIVDIGGQSTRPGATDIGEQEEVSRVLPVIRGICKALADPDTYAAARGSSGTVALSVDSYRSSVIRQAYAVVHEHNEHQHQLMNGNSNAAAAAESGSKRGRKKSNSQASSVAAGYVGFMANDTTGGLMDASIFDTVAELGVPLVVGHARAPPDVMQGPEWTRYDAQGGVIPGVAQELDDIVDRAQAAGVPLWNLVVDPALGFSKNADQCFELVSDLRTACPPGMPILSGPSRKGFIAQALKENGFPSPPGNEERDWGSAAAVTASVGSGASMVRVHNVPGARAVCAVADRVYRRKPPLPQPEPMSKSWQPVDQIGQQAAAAETPAVTAEAAPKKRGKAAKQPADAAPAADPLAEAEAEPAKPKRGRKKSAAKIAGAEEP